MSWFSATPPSQRWATALTALATATAGPLHAQTVTIPAKKQVRVDDRNAPVVIQAEDISGRPERVLNLERNVEIVRGKTRLMAESACFRAVEDEVEAIGHVKMWRFGDLYKGEQLQLNLD